MPSRAEIYLERIADALRSDGDALRVASPSLDTSTLISDQITVATAGTAVAGPDVALSNGVYIKALATNVGRAFVGNDGAGDVTSSNGFELSPGEVVLISVPNLNVLIFDVVNNNDKFCWIKA